MSRNSVQHRPYQGYPYVNPVVMDAPSIDPSAAAKWANLPRRQIGIPVRRETTLDTGEGSSQDAQDHEPKEKKEPDEAPVVYIDIPEAGGSGVAQNRVGSESEEPTFVEETILYDPFENRRIDLTRGDSVKSGNSGSSESSASVVSVHLPRQRPRPPATLNLASSPGAGTSAGISTISQTAYVTKESLVYGSHPDDSFPLSPIPVSEMPEPPPAYTEFEMSPVQQQPTREEFRTQVILPPVPELGTVPAATPTGMPILSRKFVTCQHCRANVVTTVVRESGYVTHFIAFLSLLICLPLALLVYFTNFLKHKTHYCPNCNNKIGYQYPMFDSDITYVH